MPIIFISVLLIAGVFAAWKLQRRVNQSAGLQTNSAPAAVNRRAKSVISAGSIAKSRAKSKKKRKLARKQRLRNRR